MIRAPRHFRRFRVFAAAMMVAFLPATALAHGRLKSAVPAAGSTLTVVPRELRLDFSESPDLTFSSIRVVSSTGRDIPLGVLGYSADSRRSIVTRIAGALDAGVYTVIWQMAGDDGHPVRGRYDFVIAGDATGVDVAPVGVTAVPAVGAASTAADSAAMANMHHDPVSMPEGNGFGADSPLYVLVRWLQYIGLLLAIGAASFYTFVLGFIRRRPQPDLLTLLPAMEVRAAIIGYRAALLLGVSLVLRLGAQGVAMHGSTVIAHPSVMLNMLGKTMWGWGWLLQLAGIAVAGLGFHGARAIGDLPVADSTGSSGRNSQLWWRLAALGGVLLAFSPGLSSHAAASPKLRTLAMLADGFHVLGASSWLGTLAIVLFSGVTFAAANRTEISAVLVRELINAFSPVALASAGVAVSTGVFAAWLHVGTVPNLWGTRYGLILMTKLGVLGIVAITGFYNWRFVKPRLGTTDATGHLNRSARVEVAVAAIVLLITAVLVASPTSLDMTM